ncbi:MAG: tol-pal system protein YbgF [Pseudomonadota bacterium]
MRRSGGFGLTAALVLGMAPVGVAQDASTLADIRQELSILFVELQRLNRELSTSGTPDVAIGGDTARARLQRIEEELARLTARTEDMSLRITDIVRDGTNRIGDLEFRLCELEPDCDLASLGETPMLGGALPPDQELPTNLAPPPNTPASAGGGTELAMSEQADFDAAQAALQAGAYADAAERFLRFVETYPGGPLNAEAHFLRGEALSSQGALAEAGRAYLDSFSGSPNGPRAPDALLQLGITLNALGQVNEACVMLAQVGERFPGMPQVDTAAQQLQRLSCS